MTINSYRDLQRAIQDLYAVFSSYRTISLAPAEPACVADLRKLEAVRQALRRTPLDRLTASELLDYYYLAVEHIGSVDDLRHFLPKLLDTMTQLDGRFLTPAHLPTLLNSAGFGDWPRRERDAVVCFAEAAAATGSIQRKIAKEVAQIARRDLWKRLFNS